MASIKNTNYYGNSYSIEYENYIDECNFEGICENKIHYKQNATYGDKFEQPCLNLNSNCKKSNRDEECSYSEEIGFYKIICNKSCENNIWM